MGRSMSLVTPALLKTIHAPASVQDKNSNAHIEVEVRDGKLYQTEYEKGADSRKSTAIATSWNGSLGLEKMVSADS